MGDLVDLEAFRKRKLEEEKEKKQEEEEAQAEADINYLKEVLAIMLSSLPPVTGSMYTDVDSNYYFDASNTSYYGQPEQGESDTDFFSYDWGWASEDYDDEDI